MLKQLNYVQVWVNDQDEALAFYTDKLGLELREDVTVPEMGNFRWLSVGIPGQDVSITLMAIPGPPVFDEETLSALVPDVLRDRKAPAPVTRKTAAPSGSGSPTHLGSPRRSRTAAPTAPA